MPGTVMSGYPASSLFMGFSEILIICLPVHFGV